MAPASFRIHDPACGLPFPPPPAGSAWSQQDRLSEAVYIEEYDRGLLQAPKKPQEKVLRKANAQNKSGDSSNREILNLE